MDWLAIAVTIPPACIGALMCYIVMSAKIIELEASNRLLEDKCNQLERSKYGTAEELIPFA